MCRNLDCKKFLTQFASIWKKTYCYYAYFCTMTNQKLYEIALTLVPGIGVVNGKKLVAYCGGAEAVFCEKKNALTQIGGITDAIVQNIDSKKVMPRAEQELEFMEKNGIKPLFYTRRILFWVR